MEMWRNDLAGNIFNTFLCRFIGSGDGSEPLDEATALLLDAICSVLADFADERNWLNRRSGLEEQHCVHQYLVSPMA